MNVDLNMPHIARSAIDPHGPTHVGVWLALALALHRVNERPTAPITGRHSVAKCDGAGLSSCGACVRSLAPLCASQQWVQPAIIGGECSAFASIERYGALCGISIGERIL